MSTTSTCQNCGEAITHRRDYLTEGWPITWRHDASGEHRCATTFALPLKEESDD